MEALGRSFKVLFLMALALFLTLGPADAGPNARLNGAYHFTQSRQCVIASAGFNADLSLVLPLPAGGFINKVVGVDRGTYNYDGNGAGTATIRSSRLKFNSGLAGSFNVSSPVSESEGTCTLTYTVNPDDSVDQQATCTFTVVAGENAGDTNTITGIHTRRQIVQGNTMLLHVPTDTPSIESGTLTTPAGATTQFDRICIRSGVSSK